MTRDVSSQNIYPPENQEPISCREPIRLYTPSPLCPVKKRTRFSLFFALKTAGFWAFFTPRPRIKYTGKYRNWRRIRCFVTVKSVFVVRRHLKFSRVSWGEKTCEKRFQFSKKRENRVLFLTSGIIYYAYAFAASSCQLVRCLVI
jgi:hypothetical protein